MPIQTLVIIPTYNEAHNILGLLDAILSKPTQDLRFDVLVVDDASPDGTANLVVNHKKFNQGVFLINREKKNGRGGAVIAGFRYALEKGNYTFVIEMDGDFSHNPRDLERLVNETKDFDMTVGSRYIMGGEILGWSLRRRIFSGLANAYARFILRIPLFDYTNGYERSASWKQGCNQFDQVATRHKRNFQVAQKGEFPRHRRFFLEAHP